LQLRSLAEAFGGGGRAVRSSGLIRRLRQDTRMAEQHDKRCK
jgi:hypothetical protein